MRIVITLVICFGVLTSCSKMNSGEIEDQQSIFQSINARFENLDARADSRIIIKTEFTYGSSHVELSDGALINVNETPMTQMILGGRVWYQYIVNDPGEMDFKKYYILSYVNNNGQEFNNSVKVPPPLIIENRGPITIMQGQKIELEWAAESYVNNEFIRATLHPITLDPINSIEDQEQILIPLGAGKISIESAQIDHLERGDYVLSICRQRSDFPYLQFPEKGGNLSVTSCSKNVNVRLTL